jgi:glycosyltransferase involved in cell wall biosynthesis
MLRNREPSHQPESQGNIALKILTIHNRYKYRGGEDESRESEDELLSARGHEVRTIVFDNSRIGARNALRVGLQAAWSHSSYLRVGNYIDAWRPDILDVHNFFPLASPSVYYAARKRGVPVVQTLHNYRIICPGATFYRDGSVCEDCTSHYFPWPGVLHRCYRGSAFQTGAVALMAAVHKSMRTWTRMVSLFFVLSEFEKSKFVENGFPESRMRIKPNFVVDPGQPGTGGEEFLFVGRLAPEKGIHTLLQAISCTRSSNARFQIIGDGPLAPMVIDAASRDSRINYRGRLPLSDVMRIMGSVRAVLVPSEWYETFGRVAAEALSVGTPVICTDLGAVAEIIEDGKTGFRYNPGDFGALARIMDDVCANPDVLITLRGPSRREYEAKYTPERGYQALMSGYMQAIACP